MLKTSFKNRLLQCTALVVFVGVLSTVPSLADPDLNICEDNKPCKEPEFLGKQGLAPRAETRAFASVPPNAEHRNIAGEALVLPRKSPDTAPIVRRQKDQGKADQFSSAQHLLSAQERHQIDKLVQRIAHKNIHAIEIVGHADHQPFKENSDTYYTDNQSLSLGRAREAAEYMAAVLGDRAVPISVSGKGSAKPSVNCSDKDAGSTAYTKCLASNRRVDIRVWYNQENEVTHPQGKGCSAEQQAANADLPFRISIDGTPLNHADVPNSADITRCTDIALEKADIQVRFDPLEKTQSLNVTTDYRTVVRGDLVTFMPYSNYKNYITKAEIRIFEPEASMQKKPMDVIALAPSLDKNAMWETPTGKSFESILYVLRVYNKDGRYDETAPMKLRLVDKNRPFDEGDNDEEETLSGYGENQLLIKNIPVTGGIITINGDHLAPGTTVKAMGAQIPVDSSGRFAYRQILPAGSHTLEITTEAPDGTKAEFTRSLYIPDQDWFYIALADLTAGKNNVKGSAQLVTENSSRRFRDKVYVDGRLAFYTKGKIKGDWLLTASADTQEQPLEDLFSNFTEKDPRYLLKRIDPNAYYPVYGDDSTTTEDAPTQGKFYVKLEKNNAHVMWGNFQTKITGTDLLNYSRTLYGANAEYTSPTMTAFGENKTEINGFAADPGTVSSLEEFRGTGGSLYYLRGQDIVLGSERLRIETRDRDSGIVLHNQYLIYGQDYEINYIQGRIILRDPLQSTSTSDTIVRTGSLSGNPVFLVAGYEYTPGVTAVENLTKGGRASHWVNDNLRVGVTAYDQAGVGLDQTLAGVDTTVRYAPGTYITLEKARSQGPGNGSLSSPDGGFDFSTIDQTTTPNLKANAHRAEIAVDLSEVTNGKTTGTINAYTLQRDDGFSAPGQLTNEEIIQHGFTSSTPLNEKLTIDTKADYKSADNTGDTLSAEISGDYTLDDEKTLSLAVRHDDRKSALAGGNSATLSETGRRSDAAIKYRYAPLNEEGEKERYEVYGLLQGTIHKSSERDPNNRAGLGGRYDLNDRISLNGDATTGNGGWGGELGAEYTKSERTSYYASYLIDTDRSDTGLRSKSSSFTLGGKSRYSDSLSIFSEERYQTFDNDSSGLIHSFGLDFAASDRWTWGGRFENGTISDPSTGDIERTAASLSSGYHNDKTKYAGTAELRLEDSPAGGKRTSWLVKNKLGYQTGPDWRLLADLDFAISESGLNDSLDADFIELGMGYAYRPTLNDRLNALFRYGYLQDTPSPGQLNASATSAANEYEQRSHVFSGDAIYDITPKWAIGGKVGYRFGQLKDTTIDGSDFFDSQALLLIGRADWHIVKEWDLTGELRYLAAKEAEDAKAGALIGAYRHLNQNLKVGAGYNFTDFSDDLTNLDYQSNGAFFNVIGKF